MLNKTSVTNEILTLIARVGSPAYFPSGGYNYPAQKFPEPDH